MWKCCITVLTMVAVDFCCFGSCLFVMFFGTKPGHHAATSFTKPGPAILKWPISFAPCLLISIIKSTKWRFLSSLFINRSFNTFRSIQCEQFKEKLSEIRGWGQADRHFTAHYRLFLNESSWFFFTNLLTTSSSAIMSKNSGRYQTYMYIDLLIDVDNVVRFLIIRFVLCASSSFFTNLLTTSSSAIMSKNSGRYQTYMYIDLLIDVDNVVRFLIIRFVLCASSSFYVVPFGPSVYWIIHFD